MDGAKLAQHQFETCFFLELGSREWDAAWLRLAERTGDILAEQDEDGERWQYMCSTAPSGSWVHHFRHRNHPREGRRVDLDISASPGWTPTDEVVH